MSYYGRQRRQDVVTTTSNPVISLSETLDPASTTASPTITNTEKPNSKPEIGGSEAGFIVLIVGLALVFLISCAAIFFLLRNWKHGGRTVRGKSGRVGVESSSRRDRFRRGTLFGWHSMGHAGSGTGSGRGKGWVRAPGDEGEGEDEVWDARDVGMGAYDDPYTSSYADGADDPETLKLRQGVREAVEVRRPPRQESSSYTVDLSAPGQETQAPMGERTSIVRTTTPDTLRNYPSYIEHIERGRKISDHARNESLDSAETVVSPSSLPNGTKFKEDL